MFLLKRCKFPPLRGLLQHITSPVPHVNPFGRFAATELAGEGPQGVAGHTGMVFWGDQGSCQSSRSPRGTSKSAVKMNRNTLRLVPLGAAPVHIGNHRMQRGWQGRVLQGGEHPGEAAQRIAENAARTGVLHPVSVVGVRLLAPDGCRRVHQAGCSS